MINNEAKPNIKTQKFILRDSLKISGLPIIFASLCCSSPIILFLLGISSASFASSLATDLYTDYAWHFRGVGLLALGIAVTYYLRKTKGICTLDIAKKRRNEILNIIFMSLIVATLGYVVFTYVILHYVGVLLNLWT